MCPLESDTWDLGVREEAQAVRKLLGKFGVFLNFYLFVNISMGAIFDVIFGWCLRFLLFIISDHNSNSQVIHKTE